MLSQPREDAFVERRGERWESFSNEQILTRARNLATAIHAAGLQRGDRVALIGRNSLDWIVTSFAILMSGCIVVPVFPTQAVDITAYILKHSEAKLLFVDSDETLGILSAGITALPRSLVFETNGPLALADFEATGAQARRDDASLPLPYYSALAADDLAILIYTSGTTGNPKGVMLSHDNIAFNAKSALFGAFYELTQEDRVLSVLPYSHIYEQTMLFIYLLARPSYYLCHDPNELVADLLHARPNYMTCVPRIFDRVLAGVNGTAMRAGGAQARLVPWALRIARHWARAKTFGGSNPLLSAQYVIAKRLVLDKVRAKLGLDAMKYFSSGSAALHVDVAMTYLGLGMPIMQGYGLTETSPVVTANYPDRNCYGSVGTAIPGVDISIASDGEILTRGRHVMLGYYREAEATQAVLSGGWFHTGDIGEIDAKGFLSITDRKKEVFKTATGKYVAPARVESAIKRSMFVAQAMVFGDGRPYPGAFICPNWENLRVEMALPPDATPEQLAKRSDVQEFFGAELRKRTADLGSFEQIRRAVILAREFSVESGELSPSMKVKRRIVESRHAGEIDAFYRSDPKIASLA
ncbi:MAG TPA: long-chain fatty acid--CoA ligase [Candidatus Dormibacteraeota bacterium]|nr:long-chain fatty acid--CoA ligase [Candidatus Dormibacteraeota bacterium]